MKVAKVVKASPLDPSVMRKNQYISHEDEIRFTAAFDMFDANDNGEIDSGELYDLMT